MGILRVLAQVAVVCMVILFLPGVPPYGNFDVIMVAPTPDFDGPLNPKNYALNNLERLFEGQITGPEGLEFSPSEAGVLYVTIQGGSILRISANGSSIETVTQLGSKCHNYWEVWKCGRPLGMRFDRQGALIVADAYLGIFKVNVKTGN